MYVACGGRQESFPEVCHAALCLMQIRGITLLMTQFIESDNALGPTVAPFLKNPHLQVRVNFPEMLLRCRDVRLGKEPYSSLTSTLVDLHVSRH